MTLVDTNVLLDILSRDARWGEWSLKALSRRSAAGPLLINEIIYAELSARIRTEAELENALRILGVSLERVPVNALFLAGKAYRQYRAGSGIRTGVLPDFFIGAHAQVAGLPILTRDQQRYRTYFPDVTLIAPQA